jgi:hypothetical protein
MEARFTCTVIEVGVVPLVGLTRSQYALSLAVQLRFTPVRLVIFSVWSGGL